MSASPSRRSRSAQESAGIHRPLPGVGGTRGTSLAVTEPRPIIADSAPIVLPALPAEFQPPSSHDRADRFATALVTLLPLVALAIVAPLAWGGFLHWSDVVVFVLCYVPTGLGITVGFHRLLTHRAFTTTPALRAIFTILGCMAIEGPPIEWVANHRKHHTYSDEEGDPHSPHVNFAGGLRGSLRGLWHAHLGWVFGGGMANEARYAPDLLADPVVRFVDRTFIVWVLAGLAIPFGLGWAISGGTIAGALTGCCGAARCASSCSTTSPSASTRCAISSAAASSRPATTRPTSPGWRRCRSASPGTTTITRFRARPSTASAAGSSTSRAS